MNHLMSFFLLFCGCLLLPGTYADLVPFPNFGDLVRHYPGYRHHGGGYHNHKVVQMIGLRPEDTSLLLHDTSALRLSFALNRIGGVHSLGRRLIRLSKFGHDSVAGGDGLEYLFHPIAYGPFLADRYGFPSVSRLHAQDPVSTKRRFWGRQGVARVITYTRHNNLPVGHVALWDCNHFHQAKDWVAGHSLLTVEFWQSPDSNCSQMDTDPRYLQHSADLSGGGAANSRGRGGRRGEEEVPAEVEASRPHPKLRHKHWERRFLARHHIGQQRGKGRGGHGRKGRGERSHSSEDRGDRSHRLEDHGDRAASRSAYNQWGNHGANS